jgi:hypothetical protein
MKDSNLLLFGAKNLEMVLYMSKAKEPSFCEEKLIFKDT